jgi:glycosyltransferase involved in cell wall biosynthesis
MRTIMVTKFVPLPADSGGKRRSLAVLTRLAALGPTVLCAFDDGTGNLEGIADLGVEVRSVRWDPSPRRVLSGLRHTGSVSAARFWDARLRQQLSAAASIPADLLQVEYAQLAPYAKGIEARTRVLDLHNVESALVRSMAALRPAPIRLALELEATRLRRLEESALRSFDAVAVVSDTDRARLGSAHEARILICPNGWDAAELIPVGEEKIVAFVGLLGWGPNADAAVWLAKEVWPAVHSRVPDAKLLLVGRDPSRQVLDLRSETIDVTGSVPDVRPYLARARVATAPLRAAGGSRLKILEALATGRPVVATSTGAEGLTDLVGRGIVIADSAAATSDALVALLGDRECAEALGEAGHEAVRDRYSWDTTLRPLLDFVAARAKTSF